MVKFQMWLVGALAQAGRSTGVAAFMHGTWQWPVAESLHFIGLSLIVGTIVAFDLRLLGIAQRIPIRLVHRLIPWGILGYVVNVSTGMLFLLTEPDQYIYNPSFHFKILFMAVAGINAVMFYVTSYRIVSGPSAPLDAPRAAKLVATISLCMWIGVIVGGRLLTFYRPFPCGPEGPGFIAECLPDYYHTGSGG